jgi:hypothetical protein
LKNLLTLHEAIVIALLSNEKRTLSFDEVAKFIEKRNLFPDRKGGISLSQQIILRSTKSRGQYHYLFEQLDEKTIRLKNLN